MLLVCELRCSEYIKKNPTVGQCCYGEPPSVAAADPSSYDRKQKTLYWILSSSGCILLFFLCFFWKQQVLDSLQPHPNVTADTQFNMVHFKSTLSHWNPKTISASLVFFCFFIANNFTLKVQRIKFLSANETLTLISK